MKYFAVLLITLSISALNHAASAADSVTYKIESEFAKFYIPLAKKESYEWFKSEIQDGSLEYALAVNIGTSQVGYFLYKYPGFSEVKGPLKDLLKRGQKSVWISDENSEVVSYHHSVDVFYSEPYFVISITNPRTLKLLEGLEQVSIFIRGFESSANSLTVNIE